MKRRDFLRAASGAAGASAAVGTASAQSAPVSQTDNGTAGNATDGNATAGNETGNGTGNGTDGSGSALPGEGTTKTVAVGPNGQNIFDPETVYIQPGGTIEWEWGSGGHNVAPESDSLPEGAEWEGVQDLQDEGYTYSHQFTIAGEYPYVCTPHESVGMVGSVVVNESGEAPQSEEAGLNPEEMGVPFQAHFVGIATVLMMFVSLVYTFFTVKYGESRHASSPE
jgi:plastocyanin